MSLNKNVTIQSHHHGHTQLWYRGPESFKSKGGVAIDYLSKRVFPGPVMNGMLVYMTETAGGEDAALEFLSQHEDLWMSWCQ